MLKNGKVTVLIAGFVGAFAFSANARAEHFDFNPGSPDTPFDFNPAAGGGKPYEWYYQGITLDYGGGFTDGRLNTSYADDPNGNIPYFILDGTDNSSAGHCLELVITPPNSDSLNNSQNPVHDLRISFDTSQGDFLFDELDVASPSVYGVMRVWLQNTGAGLYWHLKIADVDGSQGAWNQAATLNIWRLDKNQADCTTNSGVESSIAFIGTTGNYSACFFDHCLTGA